MNYISHEDAGNCFEPQYSIFHYFLNTASISGAHKVAKKYFINANKLKKTPTYESNHYFNICTYLLLKNSSEQQKKNRIEIHQMLLHFCLYIHVSDFYRLDHIDIFSIFNLQVITVLQNCYVAWQVQILTLGTHLPTLQPFF